MMKKNLKRWAVLLASLFLTSLSAVGCAAGAGGSDKLTVAVTIAPEAGLVKAVAGDLARVVTLVPKGAGPETYEATPRQIEEFSRADVYFTLGLPSETAKVLPAGAGRIADLGAAVSRAYPDRLFGGVDRDPHIWLSPRRAMVMVEEIARVLGEADPANKDVYAANAVEYRKTLDALDREVRETMAGRSRKAFILYHPALGYFADDYGLEMFALEEEGKEADASHLKDLVDLANREGIRVVFVSDEVETRQVQAFAEEIRGKVVSIQVLEEDYPGMIRALAEQLKEAY